ncbi:MAG TPA: enoyl-CoA hydratase-related protein [Acidimicrobiales bacterium]
MTIETKTDGAVFHIALNRPEKRNAIDGATTAAMRVALDEFEEDLSLRVAVLTGTGGTFCSGADLNAGPAGERIRDEYGLASFTNRPRKKPVIAAVEGRAFAGGFEIVLASDIVVAAEDATFAIPEVKRGVMAGTGIWRLPRSIPFATAALIVLTGDPIDARRAFELGLVSQLAPPGEALAVATSIAIAIAANAPGSVRETLGLMRESLGLNDEDANLLARQALSRLSKTADFKEGPRAFVEHREPKWTGE